jgi:6,7-dimethyl-8-ribityllumazine synthase
MSEDRPGELDLDARGLRFALVASRFNDSVVARLIDGARETLGRLGAEGEDIELVRVPGAFEVPAVAGRLAGSGRFAAVICLGAVIRGETPHFDYVAGESARGVAQVGLTAPVPVIYGILTTDSMEQAAARAGGKAGNKGSDAAAAAVEMVDVYRRLPAAAGAGPRGRRTPRRQKRRG